MKTPGRRILDEVDTWRAVWREIGDRGGEEFVLLLEATTPFVFFFPFFFPFLCLKIRMEVESRRECEIERR